MEHPITPPPQLRQLWAQQAQRMDPHDPVAWQEHIATQAAHWGADKELEACCALLEIQCEGGRTFYSDAGEWLRAARRPKPPSLKEQASASLDEVVQCLKMLVPGASVDGVHIETIRRALESLPDTVV